MQRRFYGTRALDKQFLKNASKKLHRYNLNGKFNTKMDTIKALLVKSEETFRFCRKLKKDFQKRNKRGGGGGWVD